MTTQIHRISDKQPEFPCWLWENSIACWIKWEAESARRSDEHYTHWAPDQPSAPTATPPTEQAREGGRRHTHPEVISEHQDRHAPAPAVAQGETPFRGAFPVRAGHCKPDEIVVLKSQFDGVADKLDTTLRELNAAKLEQCRVELKYDQRVEECIRLRQQVAAALSDLRDYHANAQKACANLNAMEKERDEARGIAAKAQDDLMAAWEKLTAAESELAELRKKNLWLCQQLANFTGAA